MEEFIINGQKIKHDALKKWASKKSKDPDWIKSVKGFLIEWFDKEKDITIKTSGSTGTPKDIVLTKEMMSESAKYTARTFNLNAGISALMCLSADYIAGKMMMVRALVNGWDLTIVEASSTPEIDQEYDFTAMVPLQVQNILESNRDAFESLGIVIIGGASVPGHLEKKLTGFYTRFYETYGMTETATHVALRKLGSSNKIFIALGGFEFNVDDRQCLIIEGGFLNQKIVTNDVVELLNEYRFKWMGRFDNVINSGGVKFYPESIEQRIQRFLPDRRYFITAAPDDKLGEKIVLCIEGKAMSVAEKEQLEAEIKNITRAHEAPREYIFIPQFEETDNGKVIRQIPQE